MFRNPALVVFGIFTGCASAYAADAPASAPATQPVRLLKDGSTDDMLRDHLLPLVPKFEMPTDTDAWMKEAEKLRQRVLTEVVLRGVPEAWYKTPTNVVWGDTIKGQGYIIKKLRYEIVPGFWAGALLYEPDDLKTKVPAILNVNGHVGPEGMSIPYEQIRRINLAKRGMLALGLEWTGNGELSAPEYSHHAACYLELCGISGVSIHYLALKRGLDILLEHKFADPERVAVTGLSGGGWQTIFISSLDTRVKLCAPNAGYNGNTTRMNSKEDLGDEEQSPVDLGTVCDYVHLTAMLVPRCVLFINNIKDQCCFRADRVQKTIVEPLRPLWELFGKSDRFDFHANEDPGTHNYDKDNREAFYKFLNRQFLPEDQRKDAEIPVDDEVRKQSELAIDYPKNNGSFFSLAAEAMKNLPLSKRPDSKDQAEFEFWRNDRRTALRKVIRLPSDINPKIMALDVKAKFPAPANIEAHTYLLDIGEEWVIPVIEQFVKGSKPTSTKLVLCDTNREEVQDIIDQALAAKQRVLVADILSTGECASQWGSSPYSWLWTLITAEHGQRTLGLQVVQIHALYRWMQTRQFDLPVHIITRHRISGLAALVYAALFPKEVAELTMLDMDASLKDLLNNQVNTLQSQPMYCTGLLKVVDIPELIEMAKPTLVERK